MLDVPTAGPSSMLNVSGRQGSRRASLSMSRSAVTPRGSLGERVAMPYRMTFETVSSAHSSVKAMDPDVLIARGSHKNTNTGSAISNGEGRVRVQRGARKSKTRTSSSSSSDEAIERRRLAMRKQTRMLSHYNMQRSAILDGAIQKDADVGSQTASFMLTNQESEDSDVIAHEVVLTNLVDVRELSRWEKWTTPPMYTKCFRHVSLYIFSEDSKVRALFYNLSNSKKFEAAIFVHILINCVFMAITDPTVKNKTYEDAIDYYFTAVFTMEMIIKVIAYGFVMHEHSYLRESWNVLDFISVLLSYANTIPGVANLTAVRSVRVLRMLKSLSAISSLRVVVMSVTKSMSGLFNVLMLQFFLFVTFAICGVQLFKGLYGYRCVNKATGLQMPTVPETYCRPGNLVGVGAWGYGCPDPYSCVKVGNGHGNVMNFDSFPQAIVLLFTVMTFDQWPYQLEHVHDSWGQAGFIYFLLFIVVSAYVAPNLVLAMINDKFISVHDRVMEEEQDQTNFFRVLAQKAAKKMLAGAYDPIISEMSTTDQEHEGLTSNTPSPRARARRALACLVRFQDKAFYFIEGYPKPKSEEDRIEPTPNAYRVMLASFIVLNAILLATYHYDQPKWLADLQSIGNRVFTAIFTVDCVLKILAMGPRLYVLELFNVFDFLITLGSLIELGISGSTVVVVFRTFRLFRTVKIFSNFKPLRKIMNVLVSSMKQTAFLNILVLLYLLCASLVGMQLFGFAWGAEPTTLRASYETFWKSIIISFQLMTLDGWVDIMVHTVRTTSYAAAFYFIVAILTGHYIILNLFRAILMGALDEEDIIEQLEKDLQAEEVGLDEQRANFMRTLSYQALHLKREKYQTITYMEEMKDLSPTSLSARSHSQNWRSSPMGEVVKPKRRSSRYRKKSAGTVLEGNLSYTGSVDEYNRVNAFDGSEKAYMNASVDESIITSYKSRDDSQYSGSCIDVGFGEPICSMCGQRMLRALPTGVTGKQRTAAEIHQRMCDTMGRRSQKEKLLSALLLAVHEHKAAGHVPTVEYVDTLLGHAWSSGLLLGLKTEELLPAKDAVGLEAQWENCDSVLETEGNALALRLGEEIVGRAFSSHAIKSIPPSKVTIFVTIQDICKDVVDYVWFDRLMLLCILVSSITLALDTPRYSDSPMQHVLQKLDITFTSVFCFEMVLKMVGSGLVKSGGYFRDPFNWLDFFIVIISIMSVSSQVSLSYLKVLRVFRALRALRLITRNRDLQTVVRTLFKSMKGMATVACIAMLNYTVFGILALQLFAGSFHRCTDPLVTAHANCTGYVIDPYTNITSERHWYSSPRNFDNFGNSILALFEVSTLEWWTDVMWDCVDAVSSEVAPRRDHNLFYPFVFMLFILLTSFVFLQLFLAVMMSSYMKAQESLGGVSFVTPEQRMWGEALRIFLRYEPSALMFPLNNPVSRWLFRFANHKYVDWTLYFLVCINIAMMGVDYFNRPKNVNIVLGYINDAVSGFFMAKFVVVFPALGPRYLLDPWNRLDLFLTAISVVNFVVRETTTTNVSILQALYIFRLLRMFRLMKKFKGIRILFEVVWYSLSSLINVGGFMLVLMFLFSVMGMQLFYQIDSGLLIDAKYTNFFNFWNSFQLMFRFMTMTDWNKAMHDCMVAPPFCDNSDPTKSNCGSQAAPIFFVVFVIIAAYVLTNLLTVSIVDNFNTASHMEKSELHFNDIQRFLDLWASVDKDATMLIPTKSFPKLLYQLRPPMGFSRKGEAREILKLCSTFEIPDHHGKMHFLETLIPLARHTLNVDLPPQLIKIQDNAWKEMRDDVMALPVVRIFRGAQATIDLYFAAVIIQSAHRGNTARRLVAQMRERLGRKSVTPSSFLNRRSIVSRRSLSPSSPVEIVNLPGEVRMPMLSITSPRSVDRKFVRGKVNNIVSSSAVEDFENEKGVEFGSPTGLLNTTFAYGGSRPSTATEGPREQAGDVPLDFLRSQTGNNLPRVLWEDEGAIGAPLPDLTESSPHSNVDIQGFIPSPTRGAT